MPQIVDPDIERYASEHSTAERRELQAVAAETHEKFGGRAGMLTGHLEGAFLRSLVAISGARRVLEIGTFTGYSAMAMASALPPDGELMTLDVSPEHVEVARRHIEAGPWADRIKVLVGRVLDASDTSDDTRAIVALNDFIAHDDRVECVMLTVRDGVSLIRRR